MRHLVHLIVLTFFIGTFSGCTVLDEVDKANAKMPSHGKKAVEAKAEATTTSAAGSRAQPLLEDSKRWWKNATSLAPKAVDASIVKCRLHGGTEFRSKDDCLSRGGVPQGVSG
jgi:hypothetical protein